MTTGATLWLSTNRYDGKCQPSYNVSASITVRTSTPSASVRVQMDSSAGHNGGLFTGTASNGVYTHNFGLSIGIGDRAQTTFWFDVLSPTGRHSNQIVFYNYCT